MQVPALLDADTGYGGPTQVARLVERCDKRGIAGICMEDQLSPKHNSLLAGVEHPLETPERFAEKNDAACAA